MYFFFNSLKLFIPYLILHWDKIYHVFLKLQNKMSILLHHITVKERPLTVQLNRIKINWEKKTTLIDLIINTSR